MTVSRVAGLTDISMVVEVSPDLENWFSGEDHTTVISDEDEVLIVRDNTPMGDAQRRFMRLRVSLND